MPYQFIGENELDADGRPVSWPECQPEHWPNCDGDGCGDLDADGYCARCGDHCLPPSMENQHAD